MKICECGKSIPHQITLDGTVRRLRNRTKCLECMPFGSKHVHGRKTEDEIRTYNAEKARRWYNRQKQANGGKDPIHLLRTERKQMIVDLLGGECQICGYSKCISNLVFHHISDKSFQLDSRRFQYSMKVLWPEIRKCTLICHNCHGEVHANMIDESLISRLHDHIKKVVDSQLVNV